MTVRERNLLFTLLGVAGLVVAAILFVQWFWTPYQQAQRSIDDMTEEVNKKNQSILDLVREQKRLEKYNALSLSANPEVAVTEYHTFLTSALKNSGLVDVQLQNPPPGKLKIPAAQGKKAAHLPLEFTVRAHGDIAGVVQSLKTLKNAPIAHRVKTLSLAPAESGKGSNKLNVQMTIEALIVHKGQLVNLHLAPLNDPRVLIFEGLAGLRHAPVGMTMTAWAVAKASSKKLIEDPAGPDRNYALIGKRDPFIGGQPAPPVAKTELSPLPAFNILTYVKLTHTVPTSNEAYLRNYVFHVRDTKLLPKKNSGYEYFVIMNEEKDRQMLKGKALRVDQRDVYFQVGEDVYGIHIGDSLASAMRRPLSDDEMEKLDLTKLYDAKFAEAEMAKKDTPKKGPTKIGPKSPTSKKK